MSFNCIPNKVMNHKEQEANEILLIRNLAIQAMESTSLEQDIELYGLIQSFTLRKIDTYYLIDPVYELAFAIDELNDYLDNLSDALHTIIDRLTKAPLLNDHLLKRLITTEQILPLIQTITSNSISNTNVDYNRSYLLNIRKLRLLMVKAGISTEGLDQKIASFAEMIKHTSDQYKDYIHQESEKEYFEHQSVYHWHPVFVISKLLDYSYKGLMNLTNGSQTSFSLKDLLLIQSLDDSEFEVLDDLLRPF